MHSTEDTIAAIATPLGEGGLGVIRVSGRDAVRLVAPLFESSRGADLLSAAGHTCHVGLIRSERPIDQVVVTVFRAPHSYTGEDVVEISAHGSPLVLQEILDLCRRRGARLAGPGEFTLRAFLSGRLDLTQAEAVLELIRSRTEQSRSAALSQMEGRLAGEVRALRDLLLPLLAHVEVGLDHSDEDHDFLPREDLSRRCQTAREAIERLLATARTGKVLREGWRVAITGKPNVGKSSLLNALLREERAIVTPIAGTTRDTLEEAVNWDGIPVVLTDTAGIREGSRDLVERVGIERTRRVLEQADLLLAVFDGSEPLTEEDRLVVRSCARKPHLWVVNKKDLGIRREAEAPGGPGDDSPALRVSALTGDGLAELVRSVKSLALGGPSGAAEAQWLLNARHRAALERAQDALAQAVDASRREAFEEVVALELRAALDALGEIIGATATEDLLDRIFSDFCIGK